MTNIAGFLVLALVAACGLTALLHAYALRRGIIDIPNARSSHVVPTPRGGGVSFVLVFVAALGVLLTRSTADFNITREMLWALLCGGSLTALIGFLDDHGHIPARWRFLTHLAAAALALYWLDLSWHWFWLVTVTLALVWLLNLFNFMDGIDAVAASEAISVLTSAAIIVAVEATPAPLIYLWLFLAAGVGGFLVWNWPPAKIFMGDAASGFLGLTIGLFAVMGEQTGLLTIGCWLILLGCFIVDATYTLLRRMMRGERWYEAHRSHAYQKISTRWQAQRLAQGYPPEQSRAWAHRNTTLAMLGINICWLLPLAWSAVIWPGLTALWLVIAWLPLVAIAVKVRAGVSG